MQEGTKISGRYVIQFAKKDPQPKKKASTTRSKGKAILEKTAEASKKKRKENKSC